MQIELTLFGMQIELTLFGIQIDVKLAQLQKHDLSFDEPPSGIVIDTKLKNQFKLFCNLTSFDDGNQK